MNESNQENDSSVIVQDEKKKSLYTYEYLTHPSLQQVSVDPSLICPVCGREFLNKQNLKRHIQTHTGLKNHKCPLCPQSFLRQSHLQRHFRTHTGEKPFECEHCEKRFARSDKLKQHVSQHHSGAVTLKCQKTRGRPRKIIPGKANTQNNENVTNILPLHAVQQMLTIGASHLHINEPKSPTSHHSADNSMSSSSISSYPPTFNLSNSVMGFKIQPQQ